MPWQHPHTPSSMEDKGVQGPGADVFTLHSLPPAALPSSMPSQPGPWTAAPAVRSLEEAGREVGAHSVVTEAQCGAVGLPCDRVERANQLC